MGNFINSKGNDDGTTLQFVDTARSRQKYKEPPLGSVRFRCVKGTSEQDTHNVCCSPDIVMIIVLKSMR